jgi:hypothetical protein
MRRSQLFYIQRNHIRIILFICIILIPDKFCQQAVSAAAQNAEKSPGRSCFRGTLSIYAGIISHTGESAAYFGGNNQRDKKAYPEAVKPDTRNQRVARQTIPVLTTMLKSPKVISVNTYGQ